MSRYLLVYIDTLNRKSRRLDKAALPSGYIERAPDEPIETTAQAARECFEIRSDQALRLRAISPREFAKIEAQEAHSQESHTRHFEAIFEKSGATPGKWLKLTDSKKKEPDQKLQKKREKKLFR